MFDNENLEFIDETAEILNNLETLGEATFIALDESFNLAQFFKNINTWKTQNDRKFVNEYKSSNTSDEDFEELKSLLNIIKTADSYGEYKKAFTKFCYACNILPKGVIIRKYELKKGDKPDQNKVYIQYVNNNKKIQLPDGIKLFHISKVDKIKSLIPAFRGKYEKGYLYDTPRIYFTIRRNMPKFLADYKTGVKTYTYVCKKDIKEAYVDPLVWTYAQGAIYIETKNNIPVEQITESNKDKIETEMKKVEESTDIDSLLDFISESGLILEEIE